MVLLGLLLIGALALLPLLFALRTKRVDTGELADERASALALYRGQLSELERDIASGLIDPADYESARVEIQRRLLAADKLDRTALTSSGRWRVFGLLVVIPVGAFALYIINGHPTLPPQPHAQIAPKSDPRMQELFNKLSRQVATLTPENPGYAQGHALLGQVEEANGQTEAALRDYRAALDAKFAPELALRIAELQSRRDGHINADSLALYRRALDAAPADAPWRMAVEARIATGEHEQAH